MNKKLGTLIVISLLCVGCAGKEELKVKKDLDVEINTEAVVGDFVKGKNGTRIKNKKDEIDTSELGKQKVKVKYKTKKGESKTKKIKINVVDTTKPEIECEDKIKVTVGTDVDLTKDVEVKDNSKEKIKVEVSGDYDIDKAGEYDLKYIAEDSSGNKVEKKFVLIVEEVKLKTTGYYVYKASDAWYALSFDASGNVKYIMNPCPGDACGGYLEDGTYKVKGDKISAVTKHDEMDEEWETSSSETKWDLTIIDENTIKMENYTFKYQSEFN